MQLITIRHKVMTHMLRAPTPKKEASNFRCVVAASQARFLISRTFTSVLWVTAEQPRTTSEIARALELSLETTAYRIKQLLGAGLLEIATETQHRGRAVKHYRAHPRWEVRGELLSTPSLEEFVIPYLSGGLKRVSAAFSTHLRATHEPWALRLDFHGPQFLEFRTTQSITNWLPVLEGPILHLEPQHALALHDDLRDLYQKYAALHDATVSDQYLLGLVFSRA
jgi:DNA-binding transcriptional ArsR family regulator